MFHQSWLLVSVAAKRAHNVLGRYDFDGFPLNGSLLLTALVIVLRCLPCAMVSRHPQGHSVMPRDQIGVRAWSPSTGATGFLIRLYE